MGDSNAHAEREVAPHPARQEAPAAGKAMPAAIRFRPQARVTPRTLMQVQRLAGNRAAQVVAARPGAAAEPDHEVAAPVEAPATTDAAPALAAASPPGGGQPPPGSGEVPPEGGRGSGAVRVQRDWMDLMERDAALAGHVLELREAFRALRQESGALSDNGNRRVAAVEAADQAMDRQGYTPASLLRWARAITAAQGPLTARDEWTSAAQHGRRIAASRRVNALLSRVMRDRGVQETATEDLAQRQQQADAQRPRQTTRQLMAYIRRNWQGIRQAPSVHRVRIEEILRSGLGSAEAVDAYVANPPGSQRLGQFLRLLRRNPRALQENHDNILRAVVLAVGGEWADIVVPTTSAEAGGDRAEATELTGQGETSWQAEVAGVGADTIITLFPILDQIGDARDFGAHTYALLDVDGRRPNELRSPMRWFGVAVSGIGLVPTVGSLLKGTGRILARLVGGAGSAVAGLVRRAADPVLDFVRRTAPDVIPVVERLLRGVRSGWDAMAGTARRGWEAAAQRVAGALDSVVVRVTSRGRAAAARWRRVRAAGAEMLGGALERLRAHLEPVYEMVLAGLRRVGDAIPARWLEAASAARARLAALGRELRRHLADLRDTLSGATARMQGLDAALDRLDDVNGRLRRAIDAGDGALVEELTRQAQEIAADVERRLGRSAGAHVTPPQRGAPAGTAPGRGPARGTPEGGGGPQAGGGTPDVPAGATPEVPAGATPEVPAGATPEVPAGATPEVPAGSTPGVPAGAPGRRGAGGRGGEGPGGPGPGRAGPDDGPTAGRGTDVDETPGTVPVEAPERPNPRRAPEGTPLDGGALEDEFGIPIENQLHFEDVARDLQVEIDVRPTNVAAPTLLRAGHLPKPEYIKAKSINQLDTLLGAREADIGLVGYFRPRRPVRPEGMADADWAVLEPRALRRWWQRDDEYANLRATMEQLRLPREQRSSSLERIYREAPQLDVDGNGVIRVAGETTPSGQARAFTGDHDVFDIRNADGTPLDPERYQEVVDAMRSRGMAVEHGAHMRWEPRSQDDQEIFASILEEHAPGGEALVRFAPGREPVTAYGRPATPPSGGYRSIPAATGAAGGAGPAVGNPEP